MSLITKLKSAKFMNKGIIKKIKDKIYFKYIDPKLQKKTDVYCNEIIDCLNNTFGDKKWMLSCGAFLRYHRDNTMAGQDLDIFVIAEDLNSTLPKLIEKGFLLKQIFYNNKGEYTEFKLLYKDVEIDLFHVYQDEVGYYHYFTLESDEDRNHQIERKVDGNKIIVTGDDYISYRRNLPDFELEVYEYNGSKFKGPKNAEANISALYGKNWRVYDPNYNSRREPIDNLPVPTNNASCIVYIKAVRKLED